MSMEEMSGSGVGHVDSRQSGGGPDGATASGPPSDTTAVGRGAGGGRDVRPDTAADDFPVQERDDGRWVARVRDSLGKSTDYVFAGVDPAVWDQLLADHPVSALERSAYASVVGVDAGPPAFSVDFMAAALAESCVEPGLTFEQVVRWLDRKPDQVGVLWAAAIGANLSNPFELDGPWHQAEGVGGG